MVFLTILYTCIEYFGAAEWGFLGFSLLFVFIFVCLCIFMCGSTGVHVEVREQPQGSILTFYILFETESPTVCGFLCQASWSKNSWESPASTHFSLLREFWGYRHTLSYLVFSGFWSSNPGPDALLSRSFTPWARTPAWNVESLGWRAMAIV